jgi:hypothetical protein
MISIECWAFHKPNMLRDRPAFSDLIGKPFFQSKTPPDTRHRWCITVGPLRGLEGAPANGARIRRRFDLDDVKTLFWPETGSEELRDFFALINKRARLPMVIWV